ncbi:ankyrin repeat-containing domain protein, partial [Chytriomyces sp. MP71]
MTPEKIRAPTFIESKSLNSLQLAVHIGDAQKLTSLIAETTRNLNKLDTYHGLSALHIAVDENKYDLVHILLNSSSTFDDKDITVNEQSQIAVIRGFSDIVQLLINNKAQLDVQDLFGCTALHYAIILGDNTSFKLLIDGGSSPHVTDKSG